MASAKLLRFTGKIPIQLCFGTQNRIVRAHFLMLGNSSLFSDEELIFTKLHYADTKWPHYWVFLATTLWEQRLLPEPLQQ